jgi:hypothetical protein
MPKVWVERFVRVKMFIEMLVVWIIPVICVALYREESLGWKNETPVSILVTTIPCPRKPRCQSSEALPRLWRRDERKNSTIRVLRDLDTYVPGA